MNDHLDSYRKDPSKWQENAYSEGNSEKFGRYDKHEKTRYATLLAIQYDFQERDEDLIRYLFEQEILARENDSFQGIGEALWLAAYLLATFKRADDIPLFYRAKFANFDTSCGFDREFMYLALRENTEEFVHKNYPELYNDMKDSFDSMGLNKPLDDWWKNISSRYPEHVDEEPLFTLYERNIYFGNRTRAKKYLDQWKEEEPESANKNSTMKYAYIELGEFSLAMQLLKKELDEKERGWDRASCLSQMLELYVRMDGPIEGFDVLQTLDREFKIFDDWRQVGLGRMAVHRAFEYALVSEDLEIAKSSFKVADSWFKKMSTVALVGLEAGWKAAEKCGFSWKARRYKKLVTKEKRRIANELSRIQ